jgi:hypothetical protein
MRYVTACVLAHRMRNKKARFEEAGLAMLREAKGV